MNMGLRASIYRRVLPAGLRAVHSGLDVFTAGWCHATVLSASHYHVLLLYPVTGGYRLLLYRSVAGGLVTYKKARCHKRLISAEKARRLLNISDRRYSACN